MTTARREADVLRDVLRAFDGAADVRVWRNSVGTTEEWGASPRAPRSRGISPTARAGSPDVVGVLTVGGVGAARASRSRAPPARATRAGRVVAAALRGDGDRRGAVGGRRAGDHRGGRARTRGAPW